MYSFRKTVVAVLILVATMSVAYSQTNIRVLAVSSGTPSLSNAQFKMLQIQEVLNRSSLPISIDLVAEGFAIPLIGVLPGLATNDDQFIIELELFTNIDFLRDLTAADLVFVFVDDLIEGGCGYAPQALWDLGVGMNPPGGPDTNGAELYYTGLIGTSNTLLANCRHEVDLVAHEFGHLLGAGHQEIFDPLPKLYSDSFADLNTPLSGTGGSYTVMNSGGEEPNQGPYPCESEDFDPVFNCLRLSRFSRGLGEVYNTRSFPPLWFNYNNARALTKFLPRDLH